MRQKCYTCMRPESSCMCKHANPIQTNARFVILMHPMEFKKIKNGTGTLTHLQLNNSEIIIDLDFTNNKRVNELIADESKSCFVLYPGSEAINLSSSEAAGSFDEAKNPVIFILDATWPCAKKMIKYSQNLQRLPFVSFDNTDKSIFSIKQQPHELCLSTIESTKKVIDCLNSLGLESVSTESFLKPFQKMIEFQIECVKNPNNKNHSGKRQAVIRPKIHYRRSDGRSLFFEKS